MDSLAMKSYVFFLFVPENSNSFFRCLLSCNCDKTIEQIKSKIDRIEVPDIDEKALKEKLKNTREKWIDFKRSENKLLKYERQYK